MDQLGVARKRIKLAEDNYEREYNSILQALDQRESKLTKRLNELNRKKDEVALLNGNADATNDDLVEINAGGTIIVAKRSTLRQISGTRLDALCSGRWDKKLQRDTHGRIFLDVNPKCFRAIVDYLNEILISSEESRPCLPVVNDEYEEILQHQLELFGLLPLCSTTSKILKDPIHFVTLHDWLKEENSDGEFSLLYRGSRDGVTNSAFHKQCDNKGCTLTIIETRCGLIVGGYSNTPWSHLSGYSKADRAFLFRIVNACQKMKLKDSNDKRAVAASPKCSAFFGQLELVVKGQHVVFNPGKRYQRYNFGSMTNSDKKLIKEIEVFQVVSSASSSHSNTDVPITNFSNNINEALNAHRACLLDAETEMTKLEESFKDEQTFIEKFVHGDTKDVVSLNVSGVRMVTTRSTLCIANDSVLAQQFDDTKWIEQGCNSLTKNVKDWTFEQVGKWSTSIPGIQEDVSGMFTKNRITGYELLSLNIDGLKMMGIQRAGTVCLLLKEIASLEEASRDVVTLVEHSPYCFGKILDYLRLKRLHLCGLIVEPPNLPIVCDTQKERFEKVVKYYFPGDSAKFILAFP